MKESCREDTASHSDPKSCGSGRKASAEALTGAHAGQPLSCEISQSGVPTLLSEGEGHPVGGVIGEPSTDPAQSENLSMRENSLHGNREIPASPVPDGWAGRPEKATSRTSGMYGVGKSDGCIVPQKPPNKGGPPTPAEEVEGRRPTEENTMPLATSQTQSRTDVLSGLQRVREAARSLLRQTSEVRAVCGNAARTDLRGGLGPTPVPTATGSTSYNFSGSSSRAGRVRCLRIALVNAAPTAPSTTR